MALCGISCNLFSHPACLLKSAIFHALIANQPDDTDTNTHRSHCNAENVDLEGYDIQTVPNRLACRYRLYAGCLPKRREDVAANTRTEQCGKPDQSSEENTNVPLE